MWWKDLDQHWVSAGVVEWGAYSEVRSCVSLGKFVAQSQSPCLDVKGELSDDHDPWRLMLGLL